MSLLLRYISLSFSYSLTIFLIFWSQNLYDIYRKQHKKSINPKVRSFLTDKILMKYESKRTQFLASPSRNEFSYRSFVFLLNAFLYLP